MYELCFFLLTLVIEKFCTELSRGPSLKAIFSLVLNCLLILKYSKGSRTFVIGQIETVLVNFYHRLIVNAISSRELRLKNQVTLRI